MTPILPASTPLLFHPTGLGDFHIIHPLNLDPLFLYLCFLPRSDLDVPLEPDPPSECDGDDCTFASCDVDPVSRADEASLDLSVASVDLYDSAPPVYSVSARDRDHSRGMGNYLRAPHAVVSPDPKRTRLNVTTRNCSPVAPDLLSSLPTPIVPTADSHLDQPVSAQRSTRSRRPPSSFHLLPAPVSL
jgi:hypothetical protein